MTEKAIKNVDDFLADYMHEHHLTIDDLQHVYILSESNWPYIKQEYSEKHCRMVWKQEFSIMPR